MRRPPDGRASQHGTAAVEFALVLPLILVVALALVQTGLLVRDRLLVEAAARAGARGLYLHDRDRACFLDAAGIRTLHPYREVVGVRLEFKRMQAPLNSCDCMRLNTEFFAEWRHVA